MRKHQRDWISASNTCECGKEFRKPIYLWRHILLHWTGRW